MGRGGCICSTPICARGRRRWQTRPPSEYPQTPVQRWNANIEALRVLKQLGNEGRSATPEEAAVLARYSGFGDSAFEQAFVPRLKRSRMAGPVRGTPRVGHTR